MFSPPDLSLLRNIMMEEGQNLAAGWVFPLSKQLTFFLKMETTKTTRGEDPASSPRGTCEHSHREYAN